MQPISAASADQAVPPDQPPHPIPAHILLGMALTLPRPPADAPDAAWEATVQAALAALGTLAPRDPIETMLAVQVIAADAGAIAAFQAAMDPGTPMVLAGRLRTGGTSMTRGVSGVLRALAQRKKLPVGPERDWGDVAVDIAALWRQTPVRPVEVSSVAAKAEPAEIIRWIDETPDDELAVEVERIRKEAAGEPPLPVKPGPRVVYKYKPGDYALTWKGPDPRSFADYPGWENMTMPQRRAFFGYSYTGPGCPISMLSPEAQAAHAAQQAVEAAERKEYGQPEVGVPDTDPL